MGIHYQTINISIYVGVFCGRLMSRYLTIFHSVVLFLLFIIIKMKKKHSNNNNNTLNTKK